MTSQASSFPDWTTAAVGATLAATLFAIMYGFAYAYLSYKRRRQGEQTLIIYQLCCINEFVFKC